MSFAVAAGIGAVGVIGGSLIGASAANSAAKTQANAAAQATNAQLQASREAIAFQREQAAIAQAQQRPWLEAGQNALAQLIAGTRVGTGAAPIPVNAAGISQPIHEWLQQQKANQTPSWNSPFAPKPAAPEPWVQAGTAQAYGSQPGFLMEKSTAFSTPTTAFTKPNEAFTKAFKFEADPGYAFRQAEGMKGINNSAAARGGVLSGAALKAASKYNQDFASNEYSNAYNRYQIDETGKYNRYMQDNTAEYNRYQTDNAGQFNRDVTNQTNAFNRLASIAGVGQTAANQMSANLMQSGNQISANLLNTANQIGQNTIGAGNAAAAGQIGQANALTGAIGQGISMYQNNQLMNALANRGSGYASAGGFGGADTPSSFIF